MIWKLMKHVSDLNEIDKELKVEISSDYYMRIMCEEWRKSMKQGKGRLQKKSVKRMTLCKKGGGLRKKSSL